MRSGAPAPVLKQGGLLDKQRRLITLVNKDKECYQQHIYILPRVHKQLLIKVNQHEPQTTRSHIGQQTTFQTPRSLFVRRTISRAN